MLTGHGHEVHVITTSFTQSPPDMTVHPLRLRTPLRSRRPAAFARQAAAFLRKNPFDLVHAVAPLPCADAYQPRGGLVGETLQQNVAMRSTPTRRAMKRVLVAMSPKHRSLLELERRTFREGGPTILAVSRYVARQCETYYGVRPPRVRVVFNGVAVSPSSEDVRAADRIAVRSQHHVDDDTLLLLFIAHNFRLKGLPRLIDAVALLAQSGFTSFHVLVVGRDNPVRYQRQLAALGLDRFVTFTGPTKRMAAYYHAADVCVHPTYYDPCSRVVLEALAQGVPCITTAFNGASEVMTDGREGFIIETPDAVDVLAGRIKDLSSCDLRRRMGESALSLRERVSMARHVKELNEVFVELAAQKQGCCQPA